MGLGDLPLLDFIPAISPEFRRPEHMAEWCEYFERIAKGEAVRALCAVPIRHYKTETTLHGVVWLSLRFPKRRYLLFTYHHERAKWIGERTRELYALAGGQIQRGKNTMTDWTNEDGGGVFVMSANQSRLGSNVHGVFFDDPLDEDASMNPVEVDAVDRKIAHYTARCMLEGKPGPVLGVMSRWSVDDPYARRADRGWHQVTHAAITTDASGTEHAFAPQVWDLPELRAMREELAQVDPTERVWWAQLQNDPKPEGFAKFDPHPMRYDRIPDGAHRIAYGLDMAYSADKGADSCAMVALKVVGTRCYVLEAQSHRHDAHMIESMVRAMMDRHGRGPVFSYVSGPETGIVRILRERGLPVVPMRARWDKSTRATRTVRRWNDGQVVLPTSAPWLAFFLRRIVIWNGAPNSRYDDEVDALVSGCDGIMGSSATGIIKSIGKSYPGF